MKSFRDMSSIAPDLGGRRSSAHRAALTRRPSAYGWMCVVPQPNKVTRVAPPVQSHRYTKPRLHSLQRPVIPRRAALLHTAILLRTRGT